MNTTEQDWLDYFSTGGDRVKSDDITNNDAI